MEDKTLNQDLENQKVDAGNTPEAPKKKGGAKGILQAILFVLLSMVGFIVQSIFNLCKNLSFVKDIDAQHTFYLFGLSWLHTALGSFIVMMIGIFLCKLINFILHRKVLFKPRKNLAFGIFMYIIFSVALWATTTIIDQPLANAINNASGWQNLFASNLEIGKTIAGYLAMLIYSCADMIIMFLAEKFLIMNDKLFQKKGQEVKAVEGATDNQEQAVAADSAAQDTQSVAEEKVVEEAPAQQEVAQESVQEQAPVEEVVEVVEVEEVKEVEDVVEVQDVQEQVEEKVEEPVQEEVVQEVQEAEAVAEVVPVEEKVETPAKTPVKKTAANKPASAKKPAPAKKAAPVKAKAAPVNDDDDEKTANDIFFETIGLNAEKEVAAEAEKRANFKKARRSMAKKAIAAAEAAEVAEEQEAAEVKKPATKKPAASKTTASKSTAAKKTTATKTATTAKKPAATKSTASKTTAAKKTATKATTTAKKPATTKSTASKTTAAKKTTATKTATTAKKPATSKSTASKTTAAKKTTKK